MSITALRETLRVEVKVMDFVKYFIRGSSNGEICRPHMAHLVLTADIWLAMAELVHSLKAKNSKNGKRIRTESVRILIRANTQNDRKV